MIKPSPMIFNTFQVFKPDLFTFSTFRIQRDGIPKFKKALGLGLNSAKPVGIGIKFRTTLGCTLPYLASWVCDRDSGDFSRDFSRDSRGTIIYLLLSCKICMQMLKNIFKSSF